MRSSVPRPWLFGLAFSLRGLTIGLLTVGACLGFCMRSERTQRDAAAAIRRAGGLAQYDWEWRDGYEVAGATAPAPKWLLDHLGPDYFGTVVRIQLMPDPDVLKVQLTSVGALQRIEEFENSGAGVSDAGAKILGGLKDLRFLHLTNAALTDAGLKYLRGLTKLEVLELRTTAITDVGLAHLSVLTSLKRLDLGSCHGITDAGLANLRTLTRLEELDLDDCSITDAGMVHLRDLPNLGILALGETRVSDVGLMNFKESSRLRELYVEKSAVTQAGKESLRRALPRLKIEQ
jgi:hypothetical protein